MVQHKTAQLNKPWCGNTQDSINVMFEMLKQPSLQKHRENAYLLLPLKLPLL